MENTNSNTWLKIVGGILVIGAIGFAIYQLQANDSPGIADNNPETPSPTPAPPPSSNPTPPPPPGMTPPPAVTPPGSTRKYKDGTYSAVGSYTNPASKEEVTIELVIKDDKIASAKFTGTPDNPTTVTMQNKFNSGFQALVVGKSLDEVNLTVVNGSSLTPKGFMDALTKIKAEAKA